MNELTIVIIFNLEKEDLGHLFKETYHLFYGPISFFFE